MKVALFDTRERQLRVLDHESRLRRIASAAHPARGLLRSLQDVAVVQTMALLVFAARGAQTPGVDRTTARWAKQNLTRFIATVLERLQTGVLSMLRPVHIPKPSGGTRILDLPVLAERVLGRGVGWLLNALYEPHFGPAVVGCRPGHGPHEGVRRVQELIVRARHALKFDVRDFFGSLRHDVLLRRLELRLGDRRVLALIEAMCRRTRPGEPERLRGVPQGCPASPALANVYASALDTSIRRRGLEHVRYLDDVVVLSGGGPGEVEALRHELEDEIAQDGLSLAPDKTLICSVEDGVPFLGHIITKTTAGDADVQPDPIRVERFRKYMHGLTEAMNVAGPDTEFQTIKNHLFHAARGFAEYFLPHRVSLEIATRAFHEAAQHALTATGPIPPTPHSVDEEADA